MKIFKYPVPTTDGCLIEMPEGAKALTVQVQNHVPMLWASVDPGADLEMRVEEALRGEAS